MDEGVLEKLQPHKSLKELSIFYYEGASFPLWMVEFPLLWKIMIKDCPRLSGNVMLLMPSLEKLEVVGCPLLVVSLPRLLALSQLEIRGCKEVDCVEEADFCSLNMMILSNIAHVTSLFKNKVVEGIQHVKTIFFSSNPSGLSTRDRRWALESLLSMTSLMVDGTEDQIQDALAHVKVEYLSLSDFQNLEKLPQWVCNASSLECLVVSRCPFLTTLSPTGNFPPLLKQIEIESCGELKCISTGGKLLIRIKNLEVKYCSKLEVIIERFNDDMASFENFSINDCPNIKKLPEGLHNLTSLRRLNVSNCQGLNSIAREGLPTSLKSIEISSSNIVKPLLEWGLHNLTSLETLEVSDCPGLDSIPEEGLPTSLKHLDISKTNIVKPLFERGLQNLTSLETLIVSDCQGLDSIPGEGLPTNIDYLEISNTNIVKPLFEQGLHNLTSLKTLIVSDCQGPDSIPGGLPISLETLEISDTDIMEPLFEWGLHNLIYLETLRVCSCQGPDSIPGGLPTGLDILDISDTNIAKPLLEWGFHRLLYLTELVIDGFPGVVTFPPQKTGMGLPQSLVYLEIRYFPDLKYFSTRGLQGLGSLEEVEISYCPNLVSFPMDGLPPTVKMLSFSDCPRLKQSWRWSNISNILTVLIDDSEVAERDHRPCKGSCVPCLGRGTSRRYDSSSDTD